MPQSTHLKFNDASQKASLQKLGSAQPFRSLDPSVRWLLGLLHLGALRFWLTYRLTNTEVSSSFLDVLIFIVHLMTNKEKNLNKNPPTRQGAEQHELR